MAKILIVDEEAYIRRLLEVTLEELEELGVELLMAKDGREGLEMVKAEKPALVFLDIMMPELNGYDVCFEIKKNLCLKNVYVVLLTAKGQEFDKKKGMEVGADLYVTKPFDPDYIVEIAKLALGIKK